MSIVLEKLRTEAHEVFEKGQAILDQYEGKDVPKEELKKANAYFNQVNDIRARITVEEEAEAQRKWLDEPADDMPLPGGGDPAGNGQGSKGGTPGNGLPDMKAIQALAKTMSYKRFTELADDQKWVSVVAKSMGEEIQFFDNLGQRLQAIYKARTEMVVDPRLYSEVKLLKALGLNETIGSEGGFLVGTQDVPELYTRMVNESMLASRARRFQVGAGANGIKLKALEDADRRSGYQWGGIVAYWLAEAGTKTASKPKFREIEILLQKLIGLVYATDELLQDAIGLESLIMQGYPGVMRFEVDGAVFEGNGVGKPLGILNGPSTITVAKEAGQAADTIEFENIVNMWARMWAPSRPTSMWLINQDCEPQLYTMSLAVGTAGIPVYLPAGGLSASPYATLMGRPVIPLEFSPTLGDEGDVMLVDMGQYGMVEKGGVQMASSIHVQFVTDETAFRFVQRVGGRPLWDKALTPAKSANTLAPFVKLAERA